MKIKKTIYLLLLILILCPTVVTLSRYIYNKAYDFVLMANKFYFNSDKLTVDGKEYRVNNWSGLESFNIQFELNNKKNNLLTSTSDIYYEVEMECIGDVTCEINNTEGIIYSDEYTDEFTIDITPNRIFDDNESVTVNVVARSTKPYKKTLSASFVISVGKQGISYEVVDEPGNATFEFVITNSLSSYKVYEAFGGYRVGDELTVEEYKTLSDDDKSKCASAIAKIDFQPHLLIIDSTSKVLEKAKTDFIYGYYGIKFINSIEFNMDPSSTTAIRFYKTDVNKDFTYPPKRELLPEEIYQLYFTAR